MIDRVYRLSENNSIILIGLSGMLLPLCSMKMRLFFFFFFPLASATTNPLQLMHIMNAQFQNITLAGSY